jgi:hypothetical protein
MIGALGEVAGAFAVVVTLVYLARQVRSAALQDKRNQVMQLGHRSDQLRLLLSRDPELAAIALRGSADLNALDPVERVRFHGWLLTLFEVNAAFFEFRREGSVHDFAAEGIDTQIKELVRRPGVRQWYAEHKGGLPEPYTVQIDRWLSEGGSSILNSSTDG